MSEQQPQQDPRQPWAVPPATGSSAAGEQGAPAPSTPVDESAASAASMPPVAPPQASAGWAPPGAVPPQPQGWTTPPTAPAPPQGRATPTPVPPSQGWMPASPYVGPAYPVPPQPPQPPQQVGEVAVDPRRRPHRMLVGSAAVAVIAAALGVAIAVQGGPTTETSAVTGTTSGSSGSTSTGSGSSSSAGSGASTGSDGSSSTNGGGSSSGAIPGGGGYGQGSWGGGFPGGGYGSSSGGSSPGGSQESDATAATSAQEKGVVTIDATLKYEDAESAGTGMIIGSNGLVLTNNHVVDGATSIVVTDESTGKQYTATVVGTDASEDVALLQLKSASGLSAVAVDSGTVTDGEAITAVGNAEGTGDLVAAEGTVTDTDQTMTAQTETGAAAETLDGLIEFQADVVSGDSGGPVLDGDGEVVGMTTAASDGQGTTVAYAITIEDALAVVHQIESGSSADGVTIGYPAFLGVGFASSSTGSGVGSSGTGTTSGATIASVIAGTPAESAGLVAGDTITAVGGKSVSSSDALATVLGGYQPGDRVTITWVSGSTGATHSATVTLMAGPAD